MTESSHVRVGAAAIAVFVVLLLLGAARGTADPGAPAGATPTATPDGQYAPRDRRGYPDLDEPGATPRGGRGPGRGGGGPGEGGGPGSSGVPDWGGGEGPGSSGGGPGQAPGAPGDVPDWGGGEAPDSSGGAAPAPDSGGPIPAPDSGGTTDDGSTT
jgi:hypothetical protein